jgi:hypothetical protein
MTKFVNFSSPVFFGNHFTQELLMLHAPAADTAIAGWAMGDADHVTAPGRQPQRTA